MLKKQRDTRLIFKLFLWFALIASLLASPYVAGAGQLAGEQSLTANITGQVTDRASGLPVPGAIVTIPKLTLSGETDVDGRFGWQRIPINEDSLPVTISIQKEKYGEWILQDVPLVSDDTLIITAKLGNEPYLSVVPPPRAEQMLWASGESVETFDLMAAPPPPATLPLPKNIRVRVSGSSYHCDTSRAYIVEVVDFKEYAKHVLPNEWGALWPAESLRAGAMAVKMYGWYMIALGGKWKDADVWDSTCDQVYNPNFERESTNAAVDFTWDQVLSQNNGLFPPYYRAYYDQCKESGLEGKCMGQWDSKDMADEGDTWDEILAYFYQDSTLSTAKVAAPNGYGLRYNGLAKDYRENRVFIPLDDPTTDDPGPSADIGAEDFTIEWWLKADTQGNDAPAVTCGANERWVSGNILIDRKIEGLSSGMGVSIAGGRLVFGVNNASNQPVTICGTMIVTDGRWHHVAVQRRRSDGFLWLFLDGRLEASADGPNGDISYPDGHETDVETDPFLGLGAWKKPDESDLHPFFFGWMDEMRISKRLRYTKNFSPPGGLFPTDSATVALYHFDEGIGDLITDNSSAVAGSSHGNRETGSPSIGGDPLKGTEWTRSDLFQKYFVPLIIR